VQSVKLERLRERLAQMERLGGGGDAASLVAQKEGEMLALQTCARARVRLRARVRHRLRLRA
jgi:hypothetical protein